MKANALLLSAIIGVGGLLTPVATAAEYYVATNGSDANPGTLAQPFASVARGQTAAAAGDTVYIRGGVYQFSGNTGSIGILFNKSGTSTKPINYFAYQNETPTFDFFNVTTVDRIRGFSVRADYLHFKGLEVRGVPQIITNVNESWGIRLENGADNNIFERLNLHHNEGPGLFIVDGGNNLVLNCDSHHNYDPDRGGENADGFGSHSNDAGNTFIGNRAWANSDDGYDLINSSGLATVRDSWSFRNGWIPDTTTSAGNGAGFKAGGFGLDPTKFPAVIPRHVTSGNLAFDNRTQGFYANHHPGGLDFINNTAFSNPKNFDMLADQGAASHYLRNNIAYGTGVALANATLAEIDSANNSWDGGVSLSNADFLSLSTLGLDGARQADGSLPVSAFMKLVWGSDLINAGADVDRPFNYAAPDLGAFEAAYPADSNFDGFVDIRDLYVLATHYNTSGQNWTSGDFNFDGIVNVIDLTILAANWQSSVPLSLAMEAIGYSAAMVPEPASVSCVLAAGLLTCRRPQRRREKRVLR